MQLPRRAGQHITESISYKIFSNLLPDDWIIRDITERDYGIDCYIEICSDGFVTGQLVSIQLKGTKSIVINDQKEYAVYYGIKPSTMNYWNNLPVPVIFAYVDIENTRCYILNVKNYIRKNYTEFLQEKLVSLKIPIKFELEKDISGLYIQSIYLYENDRDRYENIVSNFVISISKNIELMSTHFCRDCFLSLDEYVDDKMRILLLYKDLYYLARKFNIEWSVKSITEMIDEGQQMFGKTYFLYEKQIGDFVKGVIPIFKRIAEKIEDIFLKTESTYWERNNYFLWDFISSREYNRQKEEIKEIEKYI